MCIVPVLDAFYQTFDLSACARLFSLVLFFVGGAETYITYSILIFYQGAYNSLKRLLIPPLDILCGLRYLEGDWHKN